MDAVEQQVAGFIEKFAEPMQAMIRACRARLGQRFPQAVQLVYDNYNFFVIGFGPTTRPSDSIVSLACYRRGVNLFFLQRGPELPDPAGLLRGTGKVVRHVRLDAAADLDRPEVLALLTEQAALARIPADASAGPKVIVKSVSEKQRPRR